MTPTRCFLFVALSLAAYARDYPSDHFSIDIPEGWTEIPKSELLQLAQSLREAAPNEDAQAYDYGFRPASPPHVRVLIQVKHERWSEEVFAETNKMPRARGLIQHGVMAGSPSLAELQPKIGEMRWDPDSQVLWMRTQISNAKDGDTQILSGVHITKEGSVQIHCAAGLADYDQMAPVFVALIESVRIADDWKYQPRGAVTLFLAENWWMFVAAIGFAALLGLGFTSRKKV